MTVYSLTHPNMENNGLVAYKKDCKLIGFNNYE